MADDYAEKLNKVSVEQLDKWYKDGYITAGEHKQWLRDKAKITREKLVKENDYFTAIAKTTLANVNDGWENIVKGFEKHQQAGETSTGITDRMGKEFTANLQMFWGSLVVLTSVIDAFGDINGQRAESWALSHGAHPGVAWFIGLGTNVGSSALLPTRMAASAFVKSGVAQTIAKSKLVNKIFQTDITHDAKIMGAVVEALQREGIEDAATKVAQLTGKTVSEIAEAGLPKAIERVSFLDDAKRIANEVSLEDARKELPALMKKFGVSWPDLKQVHNLWEGTGKQALSAQRFYGYLKAIESKSDELSQAARHAIAPDATEFEQIQFAKLVTELFTGRSDKLTYSKEFMNLLLHWDPANVAKGDITAAMRTFAEDLAKLKPNQVAKLAQRSQDNYLNFGVPPPVLYEYFRNMLLFGTAPAAFVSNMFGALDLLASRAMGHPREAAAMAKGFALAVGEATRAAKMTYQIGSSGPSGRAGQGIRWFGQDALVALDAAFKAIVARGSLWADGYALGLRGGALRNFVANPTGDAMRVATERAYRATYQNDMGEFIKRFGKVAQSGPGNLYFTFLKGPLNIVKHSWDRTPGLQFFSGRLWHDILAGGTLAEDAIGRLTLSWMQAFMVWEMAKSGVITGSGPADPAQRKSWAATNERYSGKTPWGWVPYNRLDPVTMPIAFVADLAQMSDQLDEEDFSQLAMAAVFAFMRNVADKTAWSTLSNLVDVVQGFQRGNREGLTKRDIMIGGAPIVSTLSGGPLATRIKEAVDPVQRDARNLQDMIKSHIPGLSEDVPPLRDGYMDPIIPPSTIGNSWFGYFHPLVPKINPFETDPVKLEGTRLGVKLPDFPDKIGEDPGDSFDPSGPELPGYNKAGVLLTAKQRDRWQQITRNIIRNPETGIQAMLDMPEYKALPDAAKRVEFTRFMSKAKATAQKELLAEDTELGRKYFESKASAGLPKVPMEFRPEAEAAVQDIRSIYDDLNEQEKEALSRWGDLGPDQPYVKPPVFIKGFELVPERKYEPQTPEEGKKVVPQVR